MPDFDETLRNTLVNAQRTADTTVREAKEEGDLTIGLDGLVYHSHWLPPVQSPKRFSTWFFVAEAPAGDVTVDQGEILEHAWWHPTDALERAADRRIEILPPTWMTLHDLAQFATVGDCLARTAERGPLAFAVGASSRDIRHVVEVDLP